MLAYADLREDSDAKDRGKGPNRLYRVYEALGWQESRKGS